MNENRNFNEDFEIEQAGPEDVGCDLFEYELTPEGTYVPKIAYTSDPEKASQKAYPQMGTCMDEMDGSRIPSRR